MIIRAGDGTMSSSQRPFSDLCADAVVPPTHACIAHNGHLRSTCDDVGLTEPHELPAEQQK